MAEKVEKAGIDVHDEATEVKEIKRTNYTHLRSELDKPHGERKLTFKTRNGTFTVGRKYHLTDAEKEKIRVKHAKTGFGDVINPLMLRVGPYWGAVEALIRLGANQWHNLKPVHDKMQEIMSPIPKKMKDADGKIIGTDAWTHFMNKTPRKGAIKPREGLGKIEQNFLVLQRLPWKMVDGKLAANGENNPYGLKLAQFLMGVDIRWVPVPGCPELIPQVRLNTTQWDNEGDVLPMRDRPALVKKPKKSKKSGIEVEETSPSGESI